MESINVRCLLIQDLLEAEKFHNENRHLMVSSAKVRANILTQRGINWREHQVRSKRFKGKLGELYDRVMEKPSFTHIWVPALR